MVSVTACCGEETLVKNSLWWRVGWGPGENSRNKCHFLTWLSLVLSMLSLKFSTQVFPFQHVSLIGPTSSERLSKFSFWEAVWFGNGMLVTIIMNVPDTHTIYIFWSLKCVRSHGLFPIYSELWNLCDLKNWQMYGSSSLGVLVVLRSLSLKQDKMQSPYPAIHVLVCLCNHQSLCIAALC